MANLVRLFRCEVQGWCLKLSVFDMLIAFFVLCRLNGLHETAHVRRVQCNSINLTYIFLINLRPSDRSVELTGRWLLSADNNCRCLHVDSLQCGLFYRCLVVVVDDRKTQAFIFLDEFFSVSDGYIIVE